MMRAILRLVATVLLMGLAPANAQTFPAPNKTHVVDAANIIPPDREAALDAKLAGVEQQSGRQLVVATVPSLEGYPIEDYGYRLGRAWGIGQKGENNGLVLLVAPNDRKVRIEVGYGLEPIMTDALSSVIVNTQIVPAFKAGDYPGGIEAGINAIIPQLTLPPEEAAKRAQQVAAPRQGGGQVDIGNVIFWLFIFFFFILPLMRSMFGRRGRRYGSGPVVIWGPGDWGGGGSSGGGSSWGGGGGFSGGGGSFGGGGASGSW